MADLILSEAEKLFILHGIQENLRSDGRTCKDYRLLHFETDVVSNTNGSARVRLANTDILVGVKAEIESPLPGKPDEGRLEFFVDCSANATPEFEGRGGEDVAMELVAALTQAYAAPSSVNLMSLCLLTGRQCWVLYVDVLVLECGGNLFDSIGFAVKCALFNTKIPKVQVTLEENSQTEIELSDDPYDCERLDVSHAPCFVTAAQIGHRFVIDPSMEEEACSRSTMVMAVTEDGSICHTHKAGSGSIHSETLFDILEAGVKIGQFLNVQLLKKLNDEESLGTKRPRKGFLL